MSYFLGGLSINYSLKPPGTTDSYNSSLKKYNLLPPLTYLHTKLLSWGFYLWPTTLVHLPFQTKAAQLSVESNMKLYLG